MAFKRYKIFFKSYQIQTEQNIIHIYLLIISTMIKIVLVICLLIFLSTSKQCERNVFAFSSTYTLERQDDLQRAFKTLESQISIKDIQYNDELYRTYKITQFKPEFYYYYSKQKVSIKQNLNILNITGGNVKISYTFKWQKKQFGQAPLQGDGAGVVYTDILSYQKALQQDAQYNLSWALWKLSKTVITNSLTLSKFTPYKEADYNIINKMLNFIDGKALTVKQEITSAINLKLQAILRDAIKEDKTWPFQRNITYQYSDYRGQFNVQFIRLPQKVYLTNDGLSYHISMVIPNYDKFQCGTVTDQPDDTSLFGGQQQFYSNSFLKSTLRYAMSKGFLNVAMSQQSWQSRAFQFFMGDIHDVIPSTKNISTFQPISGGCNAQDDQSFKFVPKPSSIKQYQVTVNFTCSFFFNNSTKLIDLNGLVTYDIEPKLFSNYIDFVIKGIKIVPTFIQQPQFKIENKQLAIFMIQETANTALNSRVLGTGFKVNYRKVPNLWVKETQLFLYDAPQKKIQKNQL